MIYVILSYKEGFENTFYVILYVRREFPLETPSSFAMLVLLGWTSEVSSPPIPAGPT